VPAPVKLLLASSNPGKLREYQALVARFRNESGLERRIELTSLPEFDSLPSFDESAPTFAENAVGKALHYSRGVGSVVVADDSGLVVPALGGAPGVRSARYVGLGASNADRIRKLLADLRGKLGRERSARFVCVIAMAERGRAIAVFSECADGELLEAPRGSGGFGYDPIFFVPALAKSFSELSLEEKNLHSHRGKAFRKLLVFLTEKN
jgi:XTP/dITP diphosphohydrolase